MEEIKNLLKEMQQEMRQQKTDMHDIQENIKEAINKNINEKFAYLENKNELLEQKLEIQAKKIHELERNQSQRTLLIFGVAETEKNYWDLEEKVLNIINNTLNIKCDSSFIESTRRLGKRGEKVRPIVITLTTMGLKIKIQKNKKKLEQTPYYIKEYFPLEILNKRKELQKEVEKEREQGRLAIIKYDKIIILKDRDQQNGKQNNDKKKRALSVSPEATRTSTEKGKGNPTKINKTKNMEKHILRQPTLQFAPEKTTTKPQEPKSSSTLK